MPALFTTLDYPTTAPEVKARTTNGGRCRFNPNIYSCGKVCLSILGTWRSAPSEEWSSAQGLESILLSIQSLMAPNPFENEPGYDRSDDKQGMSDYIAKVKRRLISPCKENSLTSADTTRNIEAGGHTASRRISRHPRRRNGGRTSSARCRARHSHRVRRGPGRFSVRL